MVWAFRTYARHTSRPRPNRAPPARRLLARHLRGDPPRRRIGRLRGGRGAPLGSAQPVRPGAAAAPRRPALAAPPRRLGRAALVGQARRARVGVPVPAGVPVGSPPQRLLPRRAGAYWHALDGGAC